jgi:hypothetical protein
MSDMKRCPKCGDVKALTEFGKNKGLPQGVTVYCRECKREYDKITGRRYRTTESGKRVNANANLKNKYGITLDEYDAMFEAQGGVCAICGGVHDDGRRLYVDHDHATGKVRALLCRRCNTVVGFVNEDSDILLRTSEYLRRHNQ